MCVFLIMVLTASALLLYPMLQKRMKKIEVPFWQNFDFAEDIVNQSWNLYGQMYLKDESISLEQLIAPEFTQEVLELEKQQDEAVTAEEYDLLERDIQLRRDAMMQCLAQFENAAWRFAEMDYWCQSTDGKNLSRGNISSSLFAGTKEQQQSRLKEYSFAVALRFDSMGKVHVDHLWTGEKQDGISTFVQNIESNVDHSLTYAQWSSSGKELYQPIDKTIELKGPHDITVILALPNKFETTNGWYQDVMWRKTVAFENAGGTVLYCVALIVAALLGLILGAVRRLDMGNGRILQMLPVEGLITLDVFVVLAFIPLEWYSVELMQGQAIRIMAEEWMLDYTVVRIGAEVGFVLFWSVMIAAAFLSFLSYGKLFAMGLWPYLKQRSWIVRLGCWFVNYSKNLWKKVTEISLDAPVKKALGGVVLVNLGVMLLASSFWFFGIPVAIIYAVFLYIYFKKKYQQIQTDYQKLTEFTNQMAQGNLEPQSESDVGIFQPVAQNLAQVRTGFKKAVDAEVRSQKMKTELITNVSHDLKTPLTAIITYVDLLKKPDITQEQRTEYIETLDKKSQRLKQLIADLFEMSKAASRDVNLHLEQLDLCALLGQVRFELSDKLDNCGVDFRWELPEKKVLVQLDGPHTCRIFENLLINITKYALKGTRAYITMCCNKDEVQVSFKNISAAELNFAEHDLTERFVRGDASRSTEGSGLGLAIAKSFTELQDGRFEVIGDGDLFKVVITWKCDEKPQTSQQEQELI